jgi:hypothetical protein
MATQRRPKNARATIERSGPIEIGTPLFFLLQMIASEVVQSLESRSDSTREADFESPSTDPIK